ncbi:MAG: PIN domain-containing protein [Bacteroidota bacterium]
MSVTATTLLFFDASALIAAAGSQTGGSAFLLTICGRGFLRAAVSYAVLAEAEGNILTNLPEAALTRYRQQVLSVPMVIAPLPPARELQEASRVVGEKDAHVLAAALALRAPYLVTLDKPLAARVNDAGLSVRAVSPKEFITGLLPTHPAYPKLRK